MQSDGWSWENEREHGLRVIGQLLELDVHRLWDPPVVEEDYVKYAVRCKTNMTSFFLFYWLTLMLLS